MEKYQKIKKENLRKEKFIISEEIIVCAHDKNSIYIVLLFINSQDVPLYILINKIGIILCIQLLKIFVELFFRL